MLNGLDLFSGIGGLTIALAPWVRPVAYCEIERYAQGVLFSRMGSGDLPIAPIWDDIKTLRATDLPEIDIIYGGFPCQDVSTAGLRKGLDGERTGLFREAIRLVSECRPQFVFLENVPGIRKYVPTVRSELEALGYDCRDGFLSAAEVGALHIRNRWWLLAHSKRKGLEGLEPEQGAWVSAAPTRLLLPKISKKDLDSNNRENDGLRIPVDRIRGLGNAVCPLQAREAFKRLSGVTNAG
jgi:DNA (cytosine-5)-methyltransferase 1